MNEKINRVRKKLKSLVSLYILRDKFSLSTKKWFKDNGDNTLRLDYSLNEQSIVFDIGGFEGNFTNDIYQKYGSSIYIFEPVSNFYNIINKRFNNNNAIKKYNFGLSDVDQFMDIFVSNDASSVHTVSDSAEKIELKSVIEFIEQNDINQIDLLKINIKGGEFEVLPALLDHEIIHKIDNLQIQFHNFIDDAEKKRDVIRKRLSKTHKLTYEYYFIWENWKLM